MKKDLLVHYSVAFLFFFLVTLVRGYFSLDYIPLWLGAIVGTILPDLDHFIYVYILKPGDSSSLEATSMMERKKYKETWNYLIATRRERKGLLFHTAFFQLIFLLFAVYIISSSGSLFAWGIVLAFSLHIWIDQLVDYMDLKNINNWFADFPFKLDERQRVWYLWGVGIVIILLGLFY